MTCATLRRVRAFLCRPVPTSCEKCGLCANGRRRWFPRRQPSRFSVATKPDTQRALAVYLAAIPRTFLPAANDARMAITPIAASAPEASTGARPVIAPSARAILSPTPGVPRKLPLCGGVEIEPWPHDRVCGSARGWRALLSKRLQAGYRNRYQGCREVIASGDTCRRMLHLSRLPESSPNANQTPASGPELAQSRPAGVATAGRTFCDSSHRIRSSFITQSYLSATPGTCRARHNPAVSCSRRRCRLHRHRETDSAFLQVETRY